MRQASCRKGFRVCCRSTRRGLERQVHLVVVRGAVGYRDLRHGGRRRTFGVVASLVVWCKQLSAHSSSS